VPSIPNLKESCTSLCFRRTGQLVTKERNAYNTGHARVRPPEAIRVYWSG
jgi:hypothetical protein